MSGADEMARIMAEGLAAAERLQAEDDERMAAAARGEPFWRSGEPAEVVGLAPYLPAPRRPIESYARVRVVVPGGSIEAGLQRTVAEPLRIKRAELRRVIADEALALNGDALDEDSGAWLTAALEARLREAFPNHAWFVELRMDGDDEEPLTQTYAPWGMPQ